MAKSIVLYGVFLGTVICFCGYFAGADIGEGAGYEVFDLRSLGWPCVVEDSASLKKGGAENFIRSKIKKIYSAEIGVLEKTGKNDGERVEEYLAVTQLGKGYAWCAAFVSWVFAEAGFPQPRTPWSPSLFPKNRVIWERGKIDDRSVRPGTADVFGIYFANLKRIAHVGFVDEWSDKYVITVEGNTNETGSFEGDGVYKKRRLISSIYQVSEWLNGQERIGR